MNRDGAAQHVDADAVRAVAALEDASRRRLYAFVAAAHRAVTREEVAHATGISRKLAAFHLDKLVAVGLLAARYETGRRTGVPGRSPKLYERSARDVAVSLPARRPDALVELLVEAVTTARPDETASDAALRVAGQHGGELGSDTRALVRGGRLGPERAIALGETALRQRGFEPVREAPNRLRLRNCPYRPAGGDAPELVCQMNHRFLTGFVSGLGTDRVRAILAPRPGECCVELQA